MISTVTYNGDGATRIFPVAFEIKGEEYTVVYVGGVAVADRSLYDIINNAIVFNTAPVIGTNNVEIVVASTTTEIADLNAPPSTISTVLDNMADINAIAATVVPNIDKILQAGVYAGMIAISVDTIENMTAISLPQIGQTTIVRDENRGGVFIYRPTGVANGGTIFDSSSTGKWYRQYEGAVNVKWFDTPKNYSDYAKTFIPEGANRFSYYPNGDFSTGTYTITDGVAESRHYHGANMCEGYDGELHLTYRVGTTHGIGGGWSLGYRKSSDGGTTWSNEQLIKIGSTSSIFSPTSIQMTPSGKLIIVYTELSMNGIVAVAPTYFKTVASVDNGSTWFDDSTLATINATYARTHGRAKIIPSNNEYGYKLGVTAYYNYAPGLYKVAIYYSDDNGVTWSEGTPITMGIDGANETEFLPITSTYWIAIARNTQPTYFETRDGGTTWTRLGYYPASFSGHDSVAPTLDKFYKNGKIYVVLGMFSRTLNYMEWSIASAFDLSSNPNAWIGNIDTNPDYLNASGYHAPIASIEGFVNCENRFSYAIIRENYDNQYSLINFSSIDLQKEAVNHPAIYTISSGEIAVLDNEFQRAARVDTETLATLDDLDTINGGYEGQTLILENLQVTSVRDVNIKSGTGNLILNGDYRLIDTNSRLILKKTGSYWYELARAHDTTVQIVTINADVATVPKSNIPIIIYIDTEGAAATDNLTTLGGGANGQIVTLMTPSSSRDVTLVDGGNLILAGNYALLTGSSTITLMHTAGFWRELCRSTNA